jgi:soluble cytochrome b562
MSNSDRDDFRAIAEEIRNKLDAHFQLIEEKVNGYMGRFEELHREGFTVLNEKIDVIRHQSQQEINQIKETILKLTERIAYQEKISRTIYSIVFIAIVVMGIKIFSLSK